MRLTKTNQDDVDIRFFVTMGSHKDALIYIKCESALYQVVTVGTTYACPLIATSLGHSLPRNPMQRYLVTSTPNTPLTDLLFDVVDSKCGEIYAFQSHLEAMQFVRNTINEFICE